MKSLVLVPAYNEAPVIGEVLARLRAVVPSLPILVVDDGSTDPTSEIARKAGARLVQLPFNMGYGVALQTGYKYALREGFDSIVQLDGDGQHEPGDIPALLEVIKKGEGDVALGSRFLRGDTYETATVRRIGMGLFRLLAFGLTGIRFSDVTSGYQALNGDVLRFFTADRYPVDYPDADVLVMLTRSGFRIKEVPVRMYPRARAGSMHSGLRSFYYVFKMLLSVLLTPLRREALK